MHWAAWTRPGKRRVTPTVLQMEAVECGAAALGSILGYHGRFVPLEELRLNCGVSRDGTKASNILKTARSYGLKAKGFSKEPDDLVDMPLPQIVFWNFNHFVVVEGFGRNKVYLNDPAMGPRTVTRREFDESFTGVVLVFEPGEEFKRGGSPPSLLASLRRRLVPFKVALRFMLLAALGLTLLGLVVPAFTRIFVDQYLVGQLSTWVKPLLVAMGITALLSAAFTALQRYYLLRLENKLALTSSYRFFDHILRLPIEFYQQRYGGEVGTRVQLNDRVSQLLSGELATTVFNLLTVVFFVILMLFYDVWLTLLGVSIACFNLLALRWVSRKRVDLNQRLLQERGKQFGAAMSGLQMIETLKATAAESDFFSRWSGHQAKVLAADQSVGWYTALLTVVPPLLVGISTASILGVGAVRVMDGQLTLGMLIAFQLLMTSFTHPFNELVHLGGSLQEVAGEMNRIDDVMRHRALEPNRLPNPTVRSPAQLSGLVEVRNVTFGYSRLDPPLLENVSFTIRPGARLALVGSSASGKSTIAKLVAGVFQPWQGEILFDGKRPAEISSGVLHQSLALVDQDIFLFEGKVMESLTLWDSTVPEADVLQAARDACIHDDIVSRPHGYESKVEEAGANFSGGQRQRLEIARALVNNPTILICDEATSALDPVTEKNIDNNLRRRGCTCVIVAHRLSTIRDCDEIIVLERGKIVERGTHDELCALGGHYHRLIEMQ
ncbi:MAG: NHLP family bacteriocin export ABC transporter peptidase/permease/ATPase subunit [Gemmataceae bacterium]